MDKFHYTYIITNLLNGKQYIGDRSCDCEPELDSYLGSGIYLKNSKKKYGIENFSKEILELFETKQEAYDAQEKYINEYNTLIPNGYNISPKGGLGIPGSFHNEETKKKIGMAHKGKDGKEIREFNKKMKKNKSYEKQMIFSYGEKIGVEKAKEYRDKIKKSTCGKNNPMFERGFLISGEKNGMYGKISPRRGKRNTTEQNEKIRNSKLGKKRKTKLCPYCNRKISDGNYERWHGENCKLKK